MSNTDPAPVGNEDIGYLKLITDQKSYVIQPDPLSTRIPDMCIGRSNVMHPIPGVIGIADDRTISRRHAQITWNERENRWYVVCHGKHGLYLNDVYLDQGFKAPVPWIGNRFAKIRIHNKTVILVQPEPDTTTNINTDNPNIITSKI